MRNRGTRLVDPAPRHSTAGALAVMCLLALGSSAVALPLTPFRSQSQAQRYCPDDVIVWLDFRKDTYYLKRQRRYGQGSTGSFVCEREARASGFRRSLLGIR